MITLDEYAFIIRVTWCVCPHNNYTCGNCQTCTMAALANYMIYRGEY